mmetsp:Transcript_13762/g.41489  ORF Transcript_13762/g.41489 Transcript_13762/m.41489 type:complete len:206 (+) Transcript_13762:384-1001(+)
MQAHIVGLVKTAGVLAEAMSIQTDHVRTSRIQLESSFLFECLHLVTNGANRMYVSVTAQSGCGDCSRRSWRRSRSRHRQEIGHVLRETARKRGGECERKSDVHSWCFRCVGVLRVAGWTLDGVRACTRACARACAGACARACVSPSLATTQVSVLERAGERSEQRRETTRPDRRTERQAKTTAQYSCGCKVHEKKKKKIGFQSSQ